MSDLLHIGPYRVNGRIGEGGMGAVYEAFHRDSGERHAVKTLRADGGGIGIHGIRALRREVQVLAEIDHPHIVNVVDFDLDADLPWFAMEYIDGRPLSEWHRTPAETISTADTILEVADRTTVDDWDSFQAAIAEARTKTFQVPAQLRQDAPKPAPPSDWTPDAELRTKLSWFGQLARALEFLHGLQIVHGDVKPDNVLVRSDGVAVLVDFGLVSRMERRVTRSALERMRTRAQTLEYAAPERHLTAEYDARADLYALGCMLYELFAGLPPFVGPPTAVAIAHVAKNELADSSVDNALFFHARRVSPGWRLKVA